MTVHAHQTDRVRIWDPVVRVFHWTLALSLAVAWLSANVFEAVHVWAGYAAGALVLVRLVWGFVGTPYARFAHFVRSPGTVLDYLGAILRRAERRYLGHNPAGGAMIVALLLATAATAFTGWLLTTDAYWGVKWMQHVHNVLAHGLLLLVGLHVVGVLLACYRHRENLIAAMVRGTKRAAGSDDVD